MSDDVFVYPPDFVGSHHIRNEKVEADREVKERFRLLENRLEEALDRIQLLEREVERLKKWVLDRTPRGFEP